MLEHKQRLARWRSYFDLAGFLALVSLKREARDSALSYAWWVIEPLSHLLLFYVAFGVLMLREQSGADYLAILFCGLVPWRWFSSGTLLGSNALIRNGPFLKSFRLPSVVFVLSAFMESVVRAAPIIAMMVAYCAWLSPIDATSLMWLVYVMLVQAALMLAITAMASWLVALLPDIVQMIDIGLRAGLFLSGVFFSADSLSPEHRDLLLLNPMATLIDSYRDVLVHGDAPHAGRLAIIGTAALAVGIVNYAIHRRLAGRLAPLFA